MKNQSAPLTQEEKEYFMAETIKEAKKAEAIAEVPIGAIIVQEKKIIARGYNLREQSQEATAHAEMFAIQQACRKLENWRLENTQLFVTLEPCPMCSGAMVLSRIPEVYFGAKDPKAGSAGTLMNLLRDDRLNHMAQVEGGILEAECSQLLVNFFKGLREKKKAEKLLKKQKKD